MYVLNAIAMTHFFVAWWEWRGAQGWRRCLRVTQSEREAIVLRARAERNVGCDISTVNVEILVAIEPRDGGA